jgi:hypothetical protein
MNFNGEVLRFLRSDPQIRIVVLHGRWSDAFIHSADQQWLINDLQHQNRIPSIVETQAIFDRALVASIQSLQIAGKQVLVVKDVPEFDFDPILRIRSAQILPRRALAGWMKVQAAGDPGYGPRASPALEAMVNSRLQRVVETVQGVPLIDPLSGS